MGVEATCEWYLSLRKSLEFLNTVTPFTEIEDNFSKIAVQEVELKDEIRQLMANESLRGEITPKMEENLKKYCDNELVYFSNQAYNNDDLAIFMTALGDYAHLNSRNYFLTKLNLLNFQISLMDNQTNM